MKKLVITSALFAFAAAPVFAQSAKLTPAPNTQQSAQSNKQLPPAADQMAERQAKMLQQQYKLTPNQYESTLKVCLEFAHNIESMRAEHKQMTPQDFKGIQDRKNMALKQIMTADQYKAYESTLNTSKPQPPAPPSATQKN